VFSETACSGINRTPLFVTVVVYPIDQPLGQEAVVSFLWCTPSIKELFEIPSATREVSTFYMATAEHSSDPTKIKNNTET
jgi:hypothetical protein